jgi:hypothetical protein
VKWHTGFKIIATSNEKKHFSLVKKETKPRIQQRKNRIKKAKDQITLNNIKTRRRKRKEWIGELVLHAAFWLAARAEKSRSKSTLREEKIHSKNSLEKKVCSERSWLARSHFSANESLFVIIFLLLFILCVRVLTLIIIIKATQKQKVK